MSSANGNRKPLELRFGLYARVSSVEQTGPDTASIETQVENCTTLIEREGGRLVETYVDDKAYRVNGRIVEPSGERADRPQWLRMLDDLRSGKINAVAVWHAWRLFRDYRPFTDFIEVVRKKDTVVKVWHGYFDVRYAVFEAWAGKQDNDHRTAQTAKGRRAKAERGFAPTTMPAFYRTVRDERGKRIGAELRPEHRAWLDELARRFLAGEPYDEIALALGTNPATGKHASSSTLIRLLKNKFMRGLIELDWSSDNEPLIVTGQHPPAWDADTCAAIERELARRAQHGRAVYHGGRFAFSGLLRCGYPGCGHALVGVQPSGKNWPYYHCSFGWRVRHGYLPGTPHPPNGMSEHKLRRILADLGRHITPEMALAHAREYARALPAVPNAWHAEVAKLRADLAEIDAELAALPAALERARTGLEQDRGRLARRLAALESVAPPADVPPIDPEALARGILAFYALDLLTATRDELRAHFPWDALYLRAGELVAPPGS